MVESYNDMTLGQLLQMQSLKDLDAADSVKELMIISILSGKSPEELRKMPQGDYMQLKEQAAFLAEDGSDIIEPAEKVMINGTTYKIVNSVYEVNAGSYIDFVAHQQNGGDLINLLSCLIIPDGHIYGEGYDIEKVKADIMDLPLPIANYISVFWQASLAIYARRSMGQMKRMARKLPKTERKAVRAKIREIESTLSIGGESLSRYILGLVIRLRKHRD